MQAVKNIIFDLGGVIINLDIQKTISDYNSLSSIPFNSIYTQLQQQVLFDDFDKGIISETHFFGKLKQLIKTEADANRLIQAWNAMLLDFPVERLHLLHKLSKKYRIFLLSNTNETHVLEFENTLQKQHLVKNLDSFFEKVYYSCRIGMRKPDVEIFNFVITENKLNPMETIFIDDSPQHLIGAEKAGITSYLLPKNQDIIQLISHLKL